MNLEAAIVAGVPATSAQPAEKPVDAATEATTETPEVDTTETPDPAVETKDEPFPKKAINALSRRDKQIGKLRAQYEQAQAEINRLRQQAPQQPQKPQGDGEPKESDFDNYADYMRAVQKYDLQQEVAKLEGKQQQTQHSKEEQAWIAQNEQVVALAAQKFIKENPEAQAVIEENADIADEFSPELQRVFLEAGEAAPIAFHNLAKEGKLEALMQMSPAKAAIEIGRAAAQAVKPKPTTKAPAPMSPAKGTASGTKDPSQMTDEEFNAWRRASVAKNKFR